ncbi:MAG: hypothetical protein ACK4TA_22745 [Saprospiraceae bacterium]
MKHIFTFLIVCIVLNAILAQSTPPPPAPDFTITTSDGVQRRLYADYLDQGKAVVLKLFFTTCPVCLEMDPLLEPFYYEWGSGTGPVEFISLSIRANDSNDDVRRYKNMIGQLYPGAGSDGGSLTASQPYTNGTYGFFSGSPTFVVIAPDRTVKYNPRGENYTATIDSIEQALISLGVIKPAVDFHLKGSIISADSSGIPQVRIRVRNIGPDSILTDSAGNFSFTMPLVADNTYRLQLERDDDPANGVTTFDVVKVQRHVLGIEPFTSPYQLLAADVDRSGAVTVADVIQMRRVVLRIDPKFSKSNAWLFLNGNYTLNDIENPFFEVFTGEAATFVFKPTKKEVEPFSVIAIKVGDVNFSAR